MWFIHKIKDYSKIKAGRASIATDSTRSETSHGFNGPLRSPKGDEEKGYQKYKRNSKNILL